MLLRLVVVIALVAVVCCPAPRRVSLTGAPREYGSHTASFIRYSLSPVVLWLSIIAIKGMKQKLARCRQLIEAVDLRKSIAAMADRLEQMSPAERNNRAGRKLRRELDSAVAALLKKVKEAQRRLAKRKFRQRVKNARVKKVGPSPLGVHSPLLG